MQRAARCLCRCGGGGVAGIANHSASAESAGFSPNPPAGCSPSPGAELRSIEGPVWKR